MRSMALVGNSVTVDIQCVVIKWKLKQSNNILETL